MRFIDLFAGLGGFHCALSDLGHRCVYASEIDESLRVLYAQNCPYMNGNVCGDIRLVANKNAVPEPTTYYVQAFHVHLSQSLARKRDFLIQAVFNGESTEGKMHGGGPTPSRTVAASVAGCSYNYPPNTPRRPRSSTSSRRRC